MPTIKVGSLVRHINSYADKDLGIGIVTKTVQDMVDASIMYDVMFQGKVQRLPERHIELLTK